MCKPSRFLTIILVAATAFLSACSKPADEKTDNDGSKDEPSEQTDDIQVVDGKVTFKIEISSAYPLAKAGLSFRGTKIIVNNKEYKVETDASGAKTITVDAASSGTYNAAYVNTLSKNFYGSSVWTDVKLPFSQFSSTTLESMRDYPMYAAYSKETGAKLIFKEPFAMLDICVSGSESITSVKVVSPTGTVIAGKGIFSQSKQELNLSTGVSFAVLNTTCEGKNVTLSSSGTHFYVLIAPGKYSSGLDVTVCDASHRMMKVAVPAQEIAANQTVTVNADYKPESDLLFYEGFDNCVWGGNYAGGEKTVAFAPTATAPGIDGGTDLTGYEDAYEQVSYDSPGTGFVQPNDWNKVSGYKVNESHQLSSSYLSSRGFTDYAQLFRCQEYQGCIGIGAANSARGIFKSAMCKNSTGVFNGTVKFDFCLKAGFDDALEVRVSDGGVIKSAKVDGKTLDIKSIQSYVGVDSYLDIQNSSLDVPSSAAAAKTWHTMELEVERMTSSTGLELTSYSSSSGNHGIFVDNIEMRKTSEMERGTLRVLYWNIQNGMWADQANNYDNFVAFVKEYDPDVCIWCESATIYKDNTTTGIGNSGSNYKGYLPGSWNALAARYGHSYSAIGGARDNYPQVVTSKYPITTLKKITDTDTSGKPIAHGAGLHEITVSGRKIYILTLHTWPQAYGYGVSSANQEASKAANEGDYYREFEMNYVVSQTINNPEYSAQADWIFAGDFNSRSRLDNWYYKYAENSTYLLCQDVILNKTHMKDIIGLQHEGDMMSSTYGTARIDYMYASPSLYNCVKNSMIMVEDWTANSPDRKYGSGFYIPSDHRPVMVDFDLSK